MADRSSDIADVIVAGTEHPGADFLSLPYRLHAGEPHWRAPLRMERKAQISLKNPARKAVRPIFFLARCNGEPVGRLVAFINAAHDAQHGEDVAFFGYFDTIDDPHVSDALLSAAKNWAREQGRTRLIGPAMWSVNEEVGLLIDGFDHPPAVMMPYGHPHQFEAVTRNGFEKAVDIYAYRADLTDGAPKNRLVRNLRAFAQKDAGLTWRSLGRGSPSTRTGLPKATW